MSEFSTLNGYKVKDKKAVRFYDTVANMKEDTTLKEGMYVKTKGYYIANDGGHAEYIIKSSSTSYYEELNNNLVAELITGNIIDVKKFGAYCDGTHDDSDALENSLNYCNNLSSANGTWKRTVLIHSIMKVTRRIDCKTDQFKILGTSLNNARIVFSNPNSFIKFEKDNNETSYEIEIENIKFYGNYTNENSIMVFKKCVNCYLTRVETCCGGENQYNISFINCGLIFMDRCTITGSNNVASYPGNRNGIYINNLGSIFNFTNANCWNLNNLFKFDGGIQNVNIENNWIECIKSFIEVDSASDMRYMNFKIENNTINTHTQDTNFVPTTFNFISINMQNNTNIYSSSISINKNTVYLANVTNIQGNSLIYVNGIGASSNSTWDINYNNNIFSGQTLTQLSAYVFYNSDTTFYNRYNVRFKSITTLTPLDATRITDNKKIIACIITEGTRGQVTAPNGIYLGSSGNENYGNIYYENGNFYAGYEGTIKQVPKIDGTAFAYVDTSTDMVDYINSLTSALVRSGIIRRQT